MKQLVVKKSTAGDAAVDGLLGGAAAGIVMAIYLVTINLFGGEGFAVLVRFDPNGASIVNGALLHLSVSAVYGALFGIGWRWVRRSNAPAGLIGIIFGVALFAFAQIVLLPSSHSALMEIPTIHLAIAHIVYGFTLGTLVNRMR